MRISIRIFFMANYKKFRMSLTLANACREITEEVLDFIGRE